MQILSYILPFVTPDFVTVFISWHNLDIGFDVCFAIVIKIENVDLVILYKPLLQLAFPTYVIVLVIIVIVVSECSSKFAKIIGKDNPVAVLDTSQTMLVSLIVILSILVQLH